MRILRTNLARSAPVMAVVGVLALLGAACSTPPPAPVETVTFYSIADGNIHFDVVVPGDPEADPPTEDTTIPVDVDLTGIASGSWAKKGAGAFTVALNMDPGSFEIMTPDIGAIVVKYSVGSAATGSGAFNPKTGVGSFDTNLALSVEEIVGLGAVGQPCVTNLDMSLSGQIDSGTGQLSVSQNGFTVNPPAADDCGGLGGIFADLLAGPNTTNSGSLGFKVGMG